MFFLLDTSKRKGQGDVNGNEYHFITRSHFKEFVSSGKFVEHGEYEGHYYGTSLDSIKEVIDVGKVCVVNLHCQVNNRGIRSHTFVIIALCLHCYVNTKS